MNNLMELVVAQVPFVIGFIWKAAGEKAAIYKEMDRIKDAHDQLIAALDKNLSLLTQESQSSRKSLEEKVTGQGHRFGSKLERLEKKVDDLLDFKNVIAKLDDSKKR